MRLATSSTDIWSSETSSVASSISVIFVLDIEVISTTPQNMDRTPRNTIGLVRSKSWYSIEDPTMEDIVNKTKFVGITWVASNLDNAWFKNHTWHYD